MSGEKHWLYGKKMRESHRKNKGKAQEGVKNHMYGKTGELNVLSKKIYQYDLDGNYIRSFGSCEEAARNLNKKRTHISACARGERKSASGFRWSYTEPSEEEYISC